VRVHVRRRVQCRASARGRSAGAGRCGRGAQHCSATPLLVPINSGPCAHTHAPCNLLPPLPPRLAAAARVSCCRRVPPPPKNPRRKHSSSAHLEGVDAVCGVRPHAHGVDAASCRLPERVVHNLRARAVTCVVRRLTHSGSRQRLSAQQHAQPAAHRRRRNCTRVWCGCGVCTLPPHTQHAIQRSRCILLLPHRAPLRPGACQSHSSCCSSTQLTTPHAPTVSARRDTMAASTSSYALKPAV
jgi:hypothetical protein